MAAGLVRGFVDFAEGRGAARARMLAALGSAAEQLSDPDARVPLASYRAAIRAAAEASGDPAILLRYSYGTRLQEVSIVGLIVHSCASMAESMAQLNRYSRLMVEVDVMPEGPRFEVEAGAGGLWLIDRRPDPDRFPDLTESGFARFIGEFRREFGVPMARELRMTHSEPAHGALIREILDVPVTFGADRNAMLMDPEWLAIEYDEGDRSYVFGIFAERADRLMEDLTRDATVRGRVEAHLLPLLHRGEVPMEEVASALGLSRQTLYRRLRSEGVTYAQVLDALRRRMAEDYLRTRKLAVGQVAYLVGFSETSSFVRAFRRWTGVAPGTWRAM